MIPDAETARAGTALWRMIACPDSAPPAADSAALARSVARLAHLVGPALADHLIGRTAERCGLPGVAPDAVRRGRLTARFALAQQRRWLAALAGAGIETVCLKGFANAHTIYPDPALRILGDLDLLVRAADLDRTVAFFAGHGFRFHPMPAHRWGIISDASFVPLVAADGSCDIDLHIHPDSYPAYRALTTERLFADSSAIDAGGVPVRVPSPAHAFVLCVTNAAKDKFDRFSLRKVIDATVMARRIPPPDWDAIGRIARDGHFHRPLRVLCALMARLGVPEAHVPTSLRRAPRGPAGRAFARVVGDFLALFPHELPLLELLWRECTLDAEADVAAYNLWLRLRGLVRPGAGFPRGVSPETGLPPAR